MISRIFTLGLFLTICFHTTNAQDKLPELTSKDSVVSSFWMPGLGINIVDDSGDSYKDVTTIKTRGTWFRFHPGSALAVTSGADWVFK